MDMVPPAIEAREPVTRLGLFTAFLKVGLLGFGGVAAWVRHITVVERRWLSEGEFSELFGIATTLPGANTVNIATIFGDRSCGPSGAAAALAGLIGAPLLLLLAIAGLYGSFSGLQDVQAGLAGAAAAAAGLVIGTALRMLRVLASDAAILAITAGIFAASAFAHLSILLILAVAVPFSVAAVTLRARRPA